jgi:hypothetical protein
VRRAAVESIVTVEERWSRGEEAAAKATTCARDKMETAVEERDAGSVRPEGAAPVVDQQPVGTAPGDESPTGAAPATEASTGEAAASSRRRSSVAVVSLQRRESASGLPGRLAEQLRHTVVALGLSLLVAPLLLLSEALVGLFSQVLPNVRPSAPCGRLLMDENSTSCIRRHPRVCHARGAPASPPRGRGRSTRSSLAWAAAAWSSSRSLSSTAAWASSWSGLSAPRRTP